MRFRVAMFKNGTAFAKSCCQTIAEGPCPPEGEDPEVKVAALSQSGTAIVKPGVKMADL
jgi:hypothetical protein